MALSSMAVPGVVRRAGMAALLLTSVAVAAATLTPDQRAWYGARLGIGGSGAMMASQPMPDAIGEALLRWRRLRQADSYAFTDYAGFLLSYPGWPGEDGLRRAAERRLSLENPPPGDVIRFFDRFAPLTASAHARYADALLATGRRQDAEIAARAAWTRGLASPEDEARLLGNFGMAFTPSDQDLRMDRLLWDKSTAAAARQIARVTPAQAGPFLARLHLQQRDPLAASDPAFPRDAGWLTDRANWLRGSSRLIDARALLAQPLTLDRPPLKAEAWLETLLALARGAAADGQQATAYNIARQADTAFAIGTDVSQRSLGERDDYTSLVWLGATAAMKSLGRPADAVRLFDRYAAAAKSPQTRTRGLYWAGRAALAAGNQAAATNYFTLAAANPDQFYGQLAAERLGRPASVPQPDPIAIDPATRAAFAESTIVRAATMLGEIGDYADQSLFLRAIAANADSERDHALAAELARSINRPDLGVMVARNARNTGVSDFVPTGFPEVPVPPTAQGMWVMVHAISRQESQFDRNAVSRVGARGLMQLMPATARQVATRLGLPFDQGRLTSDPAYNIMLGSAFFQTLLDRYGGNHVLAVASYNAGPGNVNKWLAANGDPRMPGVDVLDWIEAIPFSETRGYVQRVLENAVVYDALNPQYARMPRQNRLSAYLGKRMPG